MIKYHLTVCDLLKHLVMKGHYMGHHLTKCHLLNHCVAKCHWIENNHLTK